MKTDIINKTKQSFELKEGNAGAFRLLKMLGAGATYSIKVDPNATYREYMVATGKTGESIFLTSDDFSEHKVIDIEQVPGKDPGGPVIYKSTPRKPRRKKSKSRSDLIPGDADAGGSDLTPGDADAGGSDPSPADANAGGSDPTLGAAKTGGFDTTPAPAKRLPWYRRPKQWSK